MNPSEEVNFEKESPLNQMYEKVEEIEDDHRFGRIMLMKALDQQNNNFNIIFKIDRVITGIKDMQLCEQQIMNRLAIENENIIEMLDYSCSVYNQEHEEFYFEGFYQYPDSDLKNEISHRSQFKETNSFTDLEIFNIIREVNNALFYFQKNKLIHGDIR